VSPLGDDALDFWLGDWAVSWAEGAGTNSVRRILDGKVVEEVFECRDADGSVLLGRSLSVRDRADGTWRQTWVDSSGAYLDLVGVESEGRIAFERTTDDGGRQRMVWLNVTADSLRWEWQRCEGDRGEWTVMWALDYQRRR
jgi:hypothetical protein